MDATDKTTAVLIFSLVCMEYYLSFSNTCLDHYGFTDYLLRDVKTRRVLGRGKKKPILTHISHSTLEKKHEQGWVTTGWWSQWDDLICCHIKIKLKLVIRSTSSCTSYGPWLTFNSWLSLPSQICIFQSKLHTSPTSELQLFCWATSTLVPTSEKPSFPFYTRVLRGPENTKLLCASFGNRESRNDRMRAQHSTASVLT